MSHFNNQFSSTLAGQVPASGGGTTNFLRADGTWQAAGGSVTVTDDTSTNATYYPVFATATSGTLTAEVSSTHFTFNPSNGNTFIGGVLTLAASQGIVIPSGAPTPTTNALYQVSGNLYFNGTQLAAGSGTTVNSGTATIDFGAGECDASVVVTGIAGISTSSKVDVRIKAIATSNHTLEESYLENITVYAGNIVNATGFTIYGKSLLGFSIGQFTIEYSWYN